MALPITTERTRGNGLPRIPSNAYNYMRSAYLSDAVTRYRNELSDPRSKLRKAFERDLGSKAIFPAVKVRERLASAGQSLEASGRTVLYPYGGVDLLSHSLFSSALDIVHVGYELFGTADEAGKFLFNADNFYRTGGRFTGYDLNSFYSSLILDSGISGIGGLALARAYTCLSADIVSLNYFKIESTGEAVFSEKDEPYCLNAVMTLRLTDRTVRMWYLRDDVMQKDSRAAGLISNMLPDHILLKASMRVFTELSQPYLMPSYYRYIEPFLQGRLRSVITDYMTNYGDDTWFWKDSADLKIVVTSFPFGYGHTIYRGLVGDINHLEVRQ